MSDLSHPGAVLSFAFHLMEHRVFVIRIGWYIFVWDVWIACPGTHPWQKFRSFCIKLECSSYICLCANTCTVKWCKACVPFETLVVEKKIMPLHFLFWSKWENFLRKVWEGVGHISAFTQSSVGTCQMGLERCLISELSWLCQLAESCLSCSWFPDFLPQSRESLRALSCVLGGLTLLPGPGGCWVGSGLLQL